MKVPEALQSVAAEYLQTLVLEKFQALKCEPRSDLGMCLQMDLFGIWNSK